MIDDVHALTQSKVDKLRKNHPDISVDSIVQECEYGSWSAILYIEYDFSLLGIEFIESEASWKRAEAFDEYDSMAKNGYCVVVYVPPKAYDDMAHMLKERGAKSNIRLFRTEKCLASKRTDGEPHND